MRGVERQEAEPRLVPGADPLQSLLHKDVGHVAFEGLPLPVFLQMRVEHRVAPKIRRLSGRAAPHEQGVLETTVERMKRGCLPQMPFAENPRAVARLGKGIRHRRHAGLEDVPAFDRVGDARAKLMPAGHQRRTRGRASRAREEIGEPHPRRGERIEMRGLQDRVALKTCVAEALVICHNQQNIRALGCGFFRPCRSAGRGEDEKNKEPFSHRRIHGAGVGAGTLTATLVPSAEKNSSRPDLFSLRA